ncbi:MAG TPA: hypothetical protein VNX68_02045, partial [Nitrosopumilaceae archaeon]|nr:hypothetical protein [Nitrosopumilaceae archaeon]
MRSRLNSYDEFNRLAIGNGYAHQSIRELFRSISKGQCPPEKLIVHRHDIDTDVDTARKMFEIEKNLNIHSSFYFRLKTLDFRLMR